MFCSLLEQNPCFEKSNDPHQLDTILKSGLFLQTALSVGQGPFPTPLTRRLWCFVRLWIANVWYTSTQGTLSPSLLLLLFVGSCRGLQKRYLFFFCLQESFVSCHVWPTYLWDFLRNFSSWEDSWFREEEISTISFISFLFPCQSSGMAFGFIFFQSMSWQIFLG